jgi:iron complex outermembrane receptor protein
VAGALVLITGGAAGMTDGGGRLTVGNLCAGETHVRVERDDHAPGQATIRPGQTASIELALRATEGEVIVIEGAPPKPVDMHSTAVVSGEALERTRGRGLSEALAEVPGVSQLRSASGVAKPIVRGQYGRRLLLLVDSIRHRAQEWGLDHTPEIDPFGADEISVVRGASGVRHGPDAIGGAVLIDPPPLPTEPGVAGRVHLIGLSNGMGGAAAGRVQAGSQRWPELAGRVEGSLKRTAAPATPDYPLDNTGVSEWNVGATAGHRSARHEYKLSYSHYQARLGVCVCFRVDSADDFYAQLERERPIGADLFRSELEIERPFQAVAHDLASGRARWEIERLGSLGARYAFQYDHRREYDVVRGGTTGPQFDFRLFTNDAELSLEHRPIHVDDHRHLSGSVGLVGTAQVHDYVGLPLVPDHRAWAGGVFAIERLVGDAFELEAGLRYDALARTASIERQDFLRLVRSGQLGDAACGTGEPDPAKCASTFHTVSASIGGLRQLTTAWSVKLDLSTASRPPNPDEQYLNGTSPTSPVLGLGKPDLGPETTYSASATTVYQGEVVAAELSAYANLIGDYIYFAPAIDENGEPIFDVLIRGAFPRFVSRPVDAFFYGVDGGVSYTPLPFIEVSAQLSMVRARNRTDDSYLVFIPPDRLAGSLTYRRWSLGRLGKSFATVSGTYVARQSRFDLAADLAPPPSAHVLVGAELGTEARLDQNTIRFGLQGSNLLDARYRDYTSLLRYFADQPGWQVLARLSFEFSTPK